MTETVTKKAKVLPFQRGDKMRREAAEWLVKLDNQLDRGGLCAAERAALRRWLGQNPEHGEILQRQAALWGDMDVLAARARTRARARRFRAPAFALATLGALAIGFIGLRFLSVSDEPGAERLYATAVGGQREERLADGSRVHLNTNSLITVQFGAGERRVRLLRGEAAFDVIHDPERPFSVYAQNRIVTALGTRFTVRLGAENVQVAVATGKVALGRARPGSASPGPVRRPAPGAPPPAEPAQEVMFLVQGQRAELPLAGNAAPVLTAMDKQARERTFAWLQGRLIFDDERLATIVAEVSRYTAVQVTIAPELGDIRLSGRFKTGDTEALLEALALARRDLAIHRGGAGDTVYIATRPTRAPPIREAPRETPREG